MHRDNSILKMDQLDFEIFMSKGIEMLQLYHFTLDKIIVLSWSLNEAASSKTQTKHV